MREALARFLDSDFFYNFKRSPLAIVAFVIVLVMVLCAFFAPWIAPHSPYDLRNVLLDDALRSPAWTQNGVAKFFLGTDDQGRDLLSTIIYGSRTSLIIGFAAVALSIVVGVSVGLLSGYVGGKLDAFLMRMADIQLSFPAILIALLISGVAKAVIPKDSQDSVAIWVLIFSITAAGWVQYARTVRGSTMVEKNKEYVQAARVIGIGKLAIMVRHVLPNVLGPVYVLATIHVATAIITEATLSFLGVGMPATKPSLGTLIQKGNDFLTSGEWWIVLFPGLTLMLIALSVNVLGDWLRDALNPKLQ